VFQIDKHLKDLYNPEGRHLSKIGVKPSDRLRRWDVSLPLILSVAIDIFDDCLE
jgi:hypothetical protein